MKSIVKCWKDFLWYLATLKTYHETSWKNMLIANLINEREDFQERKELSLKTFNQYL